MSIARILLITLLISSAIVILALFKLESDSTDAEPDEPVVAATPSKPADTSVKELPPPPVSPDEEVLAPDEMAEDEQLEKEQIAAAMAQLNGSNQEERVEAVEQLGSYPNAETETTLSQLLIADPNAEVRNAAALSLGSLDEPSDATVAALLSALEDASEDVRFSALSTLEDYLLGQEEDSPNYRRIHEGLSARVTARNLSEDLRDAITEILREPQESNVPDMAPDN